MTGFADCFDVHAVAAARCTSSVAVVVVAKEHGSEGEAMSWSCLDKRDGGPW